MKKINIFKVGTTFPALAHNHGDFDRWTMEGLGIGEIETCVLDVEHGASLPAPEDCAGVIITGSHSMVTDNLPWSIQLEQWLPLLIQAEVPLLGICYGHQLLARALGGEVGYHPAGKEIGTVAIRLLAEASDDPLLHSLPLSFPAHATHSQSALKLPPGSVHLAESEHESNHAFRIGNCAWGVQFHPEFNAAIMRSYIEHQDKDLTSTGMDTVKILGTVEETPVAAEVLACFARIVFQR
ncbi:MAG: glutamine amidotransferase [Desulfobulbaceae bacterium]|nr:MAG: glutamine amidotransferase [Desulfobulbaceae bacterium]